MAASTSVGDLCRLCGTDTLNIVRNAIFEGEGRVKKYALKISECLTLQVTQEDRLPKIMCGECTYKLDLISDFRDKAFKTETLLISKLDLDVVKPEIPDEDDGPDLNNDDVGGDDFHSSSPEPPIEPEIVVKEEDHAVEKRPGRKAATKRSMRESESEEEEEEAPAKKRGRKPKETPTATATAPVAAPPKENTGYSMARKRGGCYPCYHTKPRAKVDAFERRLSEALADGSIKSRKELADINVLAKLVKPPFKTSNALTETQKLFIDSMRLRIEDNKTFAYHIVKAYLPDADEGLEQGAGQERGQVLDLLEQKDA